MHSTSRVLVAIVQVCFDAGDLNQLNENIITLTKRRSQLKQSVAKMVQVRDDVREGGDARG